MLPSPSIHQSSTTKLTHQPRCSRATSSLHFTHNRAQQKRTTPARRKHQPPATTTPHTHGGAHTHTPNGKRAKYNKRHGPDTLPHAAAIQQILSNANAKQKRLCSALRVVCAMSMLMYTVRVSRVHRGWWSDRVYRLCIIWGMGGCLQVCMCVCVCA